MNQGTTHLIGIGGAGMSCVAQLLLDRGERVSGSDAVELPVLESLRARGAIVHVGHRAENVPPDTERVVLTAAVAEDNPEHRETRRRGLPSHKYARFLGQLAAERRTIAVGGTHGKTTCTAWSALALEGAGRCPSYLIGGEPVDLDRPARWADGEEFVVEACEYDRSFHELRPHAALITNVEAEHLDTYRDLEDVTDSFHQFLEGITEGGLVVCCADDPQVLDAAEKLRARPVTYGIGAGAEWHGDRIEPRNGAMRFRLSYRGDPYLSCTLRVPGRHNVQNAVGVAALCAELGVGREDLRIALESFRGVRRRFEILAQSERGVLVDDYAHHPTEIEAVLRAARLSFPGHPLWCLFQPHQLDRTRFFLEKFAEVLSSADRVFIADIYTARHGKQGLDPVSAGELVERLCDRQAAAEYVGNADNFEELLAEERSIAPVLLVMGAGDIWRVAHRLREVY